MAATSLIAGIAIGVAVPRPAHRDAAGSNQADRPDGPIARPRGRNVYSPDIRHDAYFRQQQRDLLAMIERQCRATRQNCGVARALRKALAKD